MAKNIVICCDGTANEFARDRTNVIKLFYTLEQNAESQIAFYHPGIGTMEAAGALTSAGRKITKLLGQAIGYGLERDISDAYIFIMNHFAPGDRLYLFGFSRGAYTARAVASLLHMYGLIRRGNDALVPYAIRMLTAINKLRNAPDAKAATGEAFRLAAEFRDHFSAFECAPHFVGVWDTVSSVGWIENPLRLPYSASNPSIKVGRHAVSLDERRAFFRTNLWRPTAHGGPVDLKQVWFSGVHCDVGGGYPEDESGLSKIALKWMIREAVAHGLLVVPEKRGMVLGESSDRFVLPNPNGIMHNSLTPKWWPAEFIPKRHFDWRVRKDTRRMNYFRPRTVPEGALIHQSVFERNSDYSGRLPKSIVVEA